MSEPVDHAARRAALDPLRSFIVQAPAGSGKTELLTQRFLRLLVTVDEPEEILAITFTRKAAGEMHERILKALGDAAVGKTPDSGHRLETWRLARAVHDRDTARAWHILDSPARLRVMTIDALHAVLSRQMPILSGVGGSLSISEQPFELYRAAARRTLLALLDDAAETAAIGLLSHLDNRFDRAETMLVELLARRDQWLRRILEPGLMSEGQRRDWLEQSLCRQIEADLGLAYEACPDHVRESLPGLAAYAADHLGDGAESSPIAACTGLEAWPLPLSDHIPVWLGLTNLLLTGTDRPRKRLTKNEGFPPAGRDEKSCMTDLLRSLDGEASFCALMGEIRNLPPPTYDEDQWRMLDHLLRLLPRCAAELDLVMRAEGVGDYVTVAQAAHRALDTGEGPTDLALALDYRLRHILVDEFQDTSTGQVRLLRLLTEGWQADDGRTLFFVGDPMQSIYGFREAEVGLFLQIRSQRRVGHVPIEPLTLAVNFRSEQGLVDWVNEALGAIMPRHEEPRLGAVRFVPATAHHAAANHPAVYCHAFEQDDGRAEASRVLQVIEEIRARDAAASIAVLVRARTHLQLVARTLTTAGVPFQAVDVEKLVERPVIQDLIALTRAVCHLADRTAWLAVYRAPWCGLELADLLVLAGGAHDTIFDSARDPQVVSRMGPAAADRVQRMSQTLQAALDERGRRPLHRLIEGTWLALGGAATVAGADDLEDARGYFRRLVALQTAGDLDDVTTLEERLADLFAVPDPTADERLQLMTIHKAKGLQFDHVLMPGLGRGIRGSDRQLLHWLDVASADGDVDLLLAAIEERGADEDPLHRYVKRQEHKKAAYELGRLLYVAVTRARQTLHLFASLTVVEKDGGQEVLAPRRGSFLHLLWAQESQRFLDVLQRAAAGPRSASTMPQSDGRSLSRLAEGWRRPDPPPSLLPARPRRQRHETDIDVDYWWAGRPGRAVGTVAHRWLERIATEGLAGWNRQRLSGIRADVIGMLAEKGLAGEQLEKATVQVLNILENCITDQRGRWILSDEHDDAASEWDIAGTVEDDIVHLTIDRQFRTRDGVRWIVDYKMGRHTGGDLEAFLDREVERYRAQLTRYARLVAAFYPDDPIRAGLYFPQHAAWRCWDPFAHCPATS